ncbi:hypothetical protein D3C78_1828310 [compost metagenome]
MRDCEVIDGGNEGHGCLLGCVKTDEDSRARHAGRNRAAMASTAAFTDAGTPRTGMHSTLWNGLDE